MIPAGWSVVTLEAVGSTNDEAMARAEAGAPEGAVVRALRQEAGRGRRGRGWDSPPGNVYSSAILRPKVPPAEAAQLSFVAALAVADMAASLVATHRRVAIKWPNDVLVDDAKISGILLESAVGEGGLVGHVVIGVGINVASAPPGTRYGATHLAALGSTASTDTVFAAYIGALARRYGEWRTSGFAETRVEWLRRAAWLDRDIEVSLGETSLRGRFVDLDERGALLLQTADGGVRRITAGDVFPPRA
ncbi:MAG: biotin--[acetyl-CoA-carboxylase] ligase [Alphaproteobacteria bacterium]|nr:biotin--[acetyl-CoA-carboxylase] ligase [Alphaproteobacteria bacterium]